MKTHNKYSLLAETLKEKKLNHHKKWSKSPKTTKTTTKPQFYSFGRFKSSKGVAQTRTKVNACYFYLKEFEK
uniref:Uncharacterized protein n=1 Tax=viral metagenome TaxID=1070528 RepID=A0A6C0IZZ3_9ZZZZ